MKTLDRYLLAKTMWPLTGCIAVALIALLLERMVRLLDLVVNKGGPFFLILKMLANLIPHYLGIAIPAAFFVGVLVAIMRMSSDSEMDAIHAMGVGLRRMLAPLMALAILLTICSAIIIGFLQPYTRYAYQALVYSVTHTAWNTALERGTFFTGLGDMTIMVEGLSDGGRQLNGIFLFSQKDDGSTTTTTAETGRLLRERTGLDLILKLQKGLWIQTTPDGRKATVLTFDDSDVPLEEALGTSVFRERGQKERELTLPELWEQRSNPPAGLTREKMDAEIHSRLVRIFSVLFLPLLAMPLGIGSRRARRAVGMVVGLILLLFYHHLLQFAESLADNGMLPAPIALWVPFFAFVAVSIWAFHLAATRPGYNPVTALIDRISESAERLRLLFMRRAPA
ncbi:MAG TPA: LPS export ABC transporter permease LptF [Dongiaceae bacterium]|jgi:lipopolysaccharide export system permease protein